MFKWKVENLALMNEKVQYYENRERIYAVERELSREEKIAFVDSMQDGKLSYLLALQEKFDREKDQLPKDKYGDVKTSSLKAWIKRNDTKYERPMIDCEYNCGLYRLCETDCKLQNPEMILELYDTYKDFVDVCFHRQLIRCEKEEHKYFREHDKYSILQDKIFDYFEKYRTSFGVSLMMSNDGCFVYDENDSKKRRKLTLEEMKLLVSKYNEIDEFIDALSADVSITFKPKENKKSKGFEYGD